MEFKCGLEREAFRITKSGQISPRDHPLSLGSKFTHPFITTDYGEAQLEIVSPPFVEECAALRFMKNIHHYIALNIGDELLWPLSMPPPFTDQIAIADFGTSEAGRLKKLYRQGITERYGMNMQLISGIHFNFSFERGKSSDEYMDLIRNYLRYGFLITYLFGASPRCDVTYIKEEYPYATSLRMSHHGYYSRIQCQNAISMNSFEEYLSDLAKMLATPHDDYQKIPPERQINANILQIENEHYARIRPKSKSSHLRPLDALRKTGIEYLEVRALDINPFSPIGLTCDELEFLVLFMTHLSQLKSPPLTQDEQKSLAENQDCVALYGRDPKLELSVGKFRPYATTFLKEMRPLAQKMGLSDLLEAQIEKVNHPELTPSARIVDAMGTMSHAAWGLKVAKEHRAYFKERKIPKAFFGCQEKKVKISLTKNDYLEKESDFYYEGYEALEISTQMIIREAHKRGIEVEILDEADNFIRLKKGDHVEIIKQANCTSRDSYLTFLIMENKEVTKKLLAEKGFRVPQKFDTFQGTPLIVKPKHTNYGLGINRVSSEEEFKSAFKEAKRFGDQVMIEEFLPGQEYRFLIIGDRCVAVLKRDPANVVGDGCHTIEELVEIKNFDPKNHKHSKVHIKLGKVEIAKLKSENFTPKSVPPKGQKVYLRENSNVSTGGDPIDVTDEVDSSYQEIALKAAQAVDAHICGVDMMIVHPNKKSNEWGIVELNFNPALALHRFPFQGKPRFVERDLIDYLNMS